MATLSGRVEESKSTDLPIGNAILICGLLSASALVLHGDATSLISRFIYVWIDLPAFCVAGTIAGLSTALYYVVPVSRGRSAGPCLPALEPWHIGLAVLAAIAASIEPVYHGFAFSMDEYMTRFQAEIFAAGRLSGEVPPEWRGFGRALHHDFARFDVTGGLIYSSYRPGMAALYALFDLAGIGRYTSAVLSAGSVILVASVARQLWPQSDSAPLVAALVLGTSQQVLIAGLTAYAMPAHLFFNLLWIRLFLADRTWTHGLAALVGVSSAALHQVHLHAFFAAPFLLMLFRPLRPWLLLYYGTIYALGHAVIIGWDQIALGAAAGGAGNGGAAGTVLGFIGRIAGILRLPGTFEISSVSALIVRLIAWQNLALVPLLVIAARRAEWSTPLRLLFASIALSIVPYVLLMPDQGHGWGYRYLHGLIGNLTLIATAGWLAVGRMAEHDRRRIFISLVAAGTLSVVIMVPLRAVQVERMVAPFARSYEHIRTSAADVVVVDTPSIYYGQDLVRNGPFLDNRPIVLDIRHVNEAQVRRLCAAYSVVVIGANDLVRFGLLRESTPVEPPPGRQRMLEQIRDSQCAGR